MSSRAHARGYRARFARMPRAALVCAVVAFLNAVSWSIITPLFQVSDEQDHFAYVQQLAETGRLPAPSAREEPYSLEQRAAMLDLSFFKLSANSEAHAISSRAQQQQLTHDLSGNLPRRGSGDAGLANSEPPLYYALQTIPYAIGSGGGILLQLQLMRLLSAVMGAITACFAFLFVREALPRAPWSWTVGGLSAALAPLLGFMSGSINPDSMLTAVCTAAFYLLARGFRRGLTLRLALVIGLVCAVGFLTKLNFLGLAPGLLLGLLVLTLRARGRVGAVALRWGGTALLLAFAPIILYVLVNVLRGHPGLGIVSDAIHLTGGHGSIPAEVSYIWQRYLPRLPGMSDDFVGVSTLRQVWFDSFVGLYGWNVVYFSDGVDRLALILALLLLCPVVRALVLNRAVLWSRVVEIVIYALMGAGVLALTGADAYLGFPGEVMEYRAARYLLPMIALAAVIPALAARGVGRRWGPAAGALVVVLFLAHDVFSQLLVISHFYG